MKLFVLCSMSLLTAVNIAWQAFAEEPSQPAVVKPEKKRPRSHKHSKHAKKEAARLESMIGNFFGVLKHGLELSAASGDKQAQLKATCAAIDNVSSFVQAASRKILMNQDMDPTISGTADTVLDGSSNRTLELGDVLLDQSLQTESLEEFFDNSCVNGCFKENE
jgi:hypothetical protein